ncbi:hypothetical protein K431DRAFT_313807 [Polychaeton citri CBS 116435]|uniref:Store-operated calcium entry-associated regulatory factor n=1 Tax=Polychaeton citri CBS 116435 TaxID=1314669 RepID=A0A9P4Q7Z2_9PEZI|nr:hypothetical protein K431DRAFT_313807 [Polychaeton citri CBS 116435]
MNATLQRFVASLLLLLASTSSALRHSKTKDAIKLSQVKTLTFKHGKLTTARRVDPVPQMTCVGGAAAGLYNVDVMQCKNAGAEYDTEDIQWKCSASLPPEFKLGSTDVICEGYDSSDDPYVLKGSCGVEYRLVLTELGEEKYGGRHWKKPSPSGGGESSIVIIFFWIAFISVLVYILYNIFKPRPNGGDNGRVGNNSWYPGGGGGGGPGNDPYDDPPPPYSPGGSFQTKPSSSTASRNYGTAPNSSSNGPWRPGFWTGTAAGAAAGYAFGNRNGNRTQYLPAQAGPSNWFGSGRQTSPPQPQASSRSSSGGSSGFSGPSSFPSPSGSRYQSSGFGGTSRR